MIGRTSKPGAMQDAVARSERENADVPECGEDLNLPIQGNYSLKGAHAIGAIGANGSLAVGMV